MDMKKIICLISLVAILLLAVGARAQKFYGAADYAIVAYSDDYGYEVDFKAIRYKLGLQATPYFALEAHYGFGVRSDTIDVMGIPITIKLDEIYGFYVRPTLPIEEKARFYGVLGIVRTKYTTSAFGFSIGDTEQDNVLGAGFEANFSDVISGTIEYIHTFDTDDYDYSGLSFGLKFYF